MGYLLYNEAFEGKSGAGSIDDLITFSIDNDCLDKMYLIVPTEKIARRLEIKIIREYFEKHRKPIPKQNLFTLRKFGEMFFEKLIDSSEMILIKDAYKMALFGEAAENADLKFFRSKGNDLSYNLLEKLAAIVSGLKEDGILAEDMKEKLDKFESSGQELANPKKYRDIYELYVNYNKLLGDKYYSGEDIFLKVNSLLKIPTDEITSKIRSIFPIDAYVHFEGFSEFKYPETEFLRNLVNLVIPVTIRIDYLLNESKQTGNGPLFGNFEDTIVKLSDAGYQIMQDKGEGNSMPSAEEIPLFLRRWLFNTEVKIENPELSKYVSILEAGDRSDEVRIIAKLVKWLILKDGFKPSEICIVSKSPKLYSGLFRDVFSEYKIPVNISDRYDLSSANTVNSIFSVLDMINGKFYHKDVFKVLNSRYFTLENKSSNKSIDKSTLISTANKLRIKGGKRNGNKKVWISTFDKRINHIDNQLINSANNSEDELNIYSLRNELQITKQVRNDFESFLSYFEITKSNFSPDEFRELIKEKIIGNLKVWENINEFTKIKVSESDAINKLSFYESIEKDTASLIEFQKVLNELCSVLKDRSTNKEHNLEELTEKLKLSVLGSRYQIKEKTNFGVTVTSIEQIRQIPYKVSILCGALDGEFPVLYRPDIFLGEEIPEAEDRHLCAERVLFYQFLSNNQEAYKNEGKRVYITYPKTKNAEQLVRSPFVDALLRISDIEKDKKVFDMPAIRIKLKNSAEDEPGDQDDDKVEFDRMICSDIEFDTYSGNIINNTLKKEMKSPDYKLNIAEIPLSAELEHVRNSLYKAYGKKNTNIDWDALFSSESIHTTFPKERVYSASELEIYSQCPFRYFLSYVIRIPEAVKFEPGVSSLESGNLLHSVLYKFFMTMRKKVDEDNLSTRIKSLKGEPDIVFVRLDEKLHEKNLELMNTIAIAELDAIRFNHPYFDIFEKEVLGFAGKMSLTEYWLKIEYQRLRGPKTLPAVFEFSFGMGKSGKAVKLADNLMLKGKIDRIEMDEEGKRLLIADYKSSVSSAKKAKDIVDGVALQLPLYIMAAKSLLSESYDLSFEEESAVYYLLKPQFDKKDAVITHLPIETKKFTIHILMQIALMHATHNVEEINQGKFPVKPKSASSCTFCSFKTVCKIGAKS